MPPDVRHLYEDAFRRVGSVLADKDGDGTPNVAEGKASSDAHTIVESKIIVNGRSFGSVEEMPADVRELCESATRHTGQTRGARVAQTRDGVTLSMGFSKRGIRLTDDSAAPTQTPNPFEPSAIESGVRTAVVVIACLVGATLLALVLLGSR